VINAKACLYCNTKACLYCKNDQAAATPSSPLSTTFACPWNNSDCVRRDRSNPFQNQEQFVRHLNFSTALRIINSLDSDIAKLMKGG
jgi:hypothetical protein